jgi:putative Ca2+/H+ antiporter (TMEM165/GDT1 family)
VRTLLVIFGSVLFVELGDKTQLATLTYATDRSVRPLSVFLAASAALVFSTFVTVLLGSTIARHIPAATLKLVSGVAFIAIGIWVIASR